MRRMMAAEEASLRGGLLRAHHEILRALDAPRAGASRLARRLLRDSDRRFLRLLQAAGQRPASGHGRRRIHPRLRDAARQFAAGNQPRDLPRRADHSRRSRGGKHLAAHRLAVGARRGHRAQHRRHLREAEGQAQPRHRRNHQRGSRQGDKRRSRRWTSTSRRCCRT